MVASCWREGEGIIYDVRTGLEKWCKIAVGLIDPVVSANAASSVVCAKIMQPARNDFRNQLLTMQ